MSLFSHILSNSPSTEVNLSQTIPDNAKDGTAYLSTLTNGQTITGKIVGLDGSKVVIDLGNGSYVNAKLDNAMDLNKGQFVSFEVKTNGGQQVTLTPLYTNLTQDATASKALLAANMAVSNETLSMTSAMIDAGMSIDKNSLGDMYHLMNSFPEAEPTQIVQMKKMGIEINDNSIQQFKAFSNYKNELLSGISTIIDDIPKVIQEMNQSGHTTEAVEFMKNLTALLSENPDMENPETIPAQSQPMLSNQPLEDLIKGLKQWMELPVLNDGTLVDEKEVLKEGSKEILDTNQELPVEEKLSEDNVIEKMNPPKVAEEAIPTSGKEEIAQTVKQQLIHILEQSGAPKELIDQMKALPMENREMLAVVHAYMENATDLSSKTHALLHQGIQKLMQEDSLAELVKEGMRDAWMLQPEEVGKKQNVDALYQRLNQQTKALSSMLTKLPIQSGNIAQNLGQMNQNMDFMNQMNQMVQYVQIPLKMSGQDATGDLYVYTNKKNLASKDGNVSAMLHLDMKHLGMVDVYASMSEGKNVSTKFYLANDEMLDFIGQNIHILNERLEKRGYHVSAQMALIDSEKQAVRSNEPPMSAPQKLIRSQSFDMRA